MDALCGEDGPQEGRDGRRLRGVQLQPDGATGGKHARQIGDQGADEIESFRAAIEGQPGLGIEVRILPDLSGRQIRQVGEHEVDRAPDRFQERTAHERQARLYGSGELLGVATRGGERSGGDVGRDHRQREVGRGEPGEADRDRARPRADIDDGRRGP